MIRGWRGLSVASSVAMLLSLTAAHAQPSHSSEVITSWNSLAHDIAVVEDQFLTFKGQRALAMMHLAMHDAVNAIVPVYETYAFRGSDRLAHPLAAAAQAAYDVLLSEPRPGGGARGSTHAIACTDAAGRAQGWRG